MNNDALGEVKFEQREIGNPEYGCALGHIDFAAFARSVGAQGFHAASVGDLRPAVRAWLAASGPAVLDIQVDAEEPTRKPEELNA